MSGKLVLEFSKFGLFWLVIIFAIYLLQNRYERIGNQFALNELIDIHHKKNYFVSSGPNRPMCPLYPNELSKLKKSRLFIKLKFK